MTNISTEIQGLLAKGVTLSQSINEVVRSEIETAVNELLQTELTVFLDYEKYDPKGYNSGNSRNGSYTRQLSTKYGDITVEIPRDRKGEFKQQTVPVYKRTDDALETTVIQLYQKGVTTSEIADLVEKMYGHYYTPATVSNITKQVEIHVKEFHERKLQSRYVVIYGDATYINIRRDTVAKEALHVLIGIDEYGYKEVLDYRLYPTEGASNYRDMLEGLKQRGVEQVLLFITDGLKEIRNACLEVFPHAKHQGCWVHLDRAIAKHVRNKDRKEVLDDVKKIYQSKTKEEAQTAAKAYEEKYKKKYPQAVQVLKNTESLYSFYDFPKEIRSSLYTSNLIEGFNKMLKKDIKRKEQFPNEASEDRFICVKSLDYNRKFGNHIHKGFGKVTAELISMFR
jgi:transposase-like protein